MRFLAYLLTLFLVGTAVAQNPTILQGNYITNVFGNSNFVLNPNAQSNVYNVTVSSATVTRSTTTPLVATSEFNITTSTSTGSATWSTRTFDAGMKGQNCEARFSYRGFSVGSTTAQILQGANVVAQLTLTASTDPRIASINFPCGDLSSATTFRLQQATASLTGTNEIGGIYVGLATNMANVAQAELVGTFRMTGVASCLFSTSSLSYGTPSNYSTAVSACNTPTTTGDITSIGKVPGFNINVKPGKYYVVVNAPFYRNNVTAGAFWTLTDGTTRSEDTINYIGTGADSFTPNTINYVFDYSTSGTKTIYLDAKVDFGTAQAGIQNYSGRAITFYVYRFPSSSELVVTPERQNVFGSVTYRGAANSIGLFSGVASSGTYTTFSSATWTGYRDFKGSRCEAPISGDNIGCQIKNMPVGTYKITVSGLMYETNSASGNNNCSYLIQETESSTDVAYRTSNLNNTSGGIIYSGSTFTGTFKNTSVANRNFIIRSAKTFDNTSGNTGTCNIFTSNSGNDKTDFNIIIEPLDQPSNSALYVQGPVLGAQTGAAISAGYQGETKTALSTLNTAFAATGAWKAFTSLNLEPGNWMCVAAATLYCPAANCSDLIVQATGASATPISADGLVIGLDTRTYAAYYSNGTVPFYVRSTGSNIIMYDGTSYSGSTMYLNARVVYPSGSPVMPYGRLSCTRLN